MALMAMTPDLLINTGNAESWFQSIGTAYMWDLHARLRSGDTKSCGGFELTVSYIFMHFF